jgi:hypothetical protein
MDITYFKAKHKNLIEKGVIKFTNEHPYFKTTSLALLEYFPQSQVDAARKTGLWHGDYIVLDRYNETTGEFLAEAKELNSPRADILKMGYQKEIGIGVYKKF